MKRNYKHTKKYKVFSNTKCKNIYKKYIQSNTKYCISYKEIHENLKCNIGFCVSLITKINCYHVAIKVWDFSWIRRSIKSNAYTAYELIPNMPWKYKPMKLSWFPNPCKGKPSNVTTHIVYQYTTYSRLTISQSASARLILAREEVLMLKLFPIMLIVIFPDCGILLGVKLVTLTTWEKYIGKSNLVYIITTTSNTYMRPSEQVQLQWYFNKCMHASLLQL